MMRLRSPLLFAGVLVLASATASAGRSARLAKDGPPAESLSAKVVMEVYKSPTCGCCKAWVDRMKAAGFDTKVTDLPEAALQKEKARLGVTDNLASCHTAVVNGYVVEGHVPAEDIQRMLRDKPKIAGIAAPGMPRGSPGMEVPGGTKDAFDVVAFTKAGKTSVYAKH